MLLVGLGVIGAIARRGRKNRHPGSETGDKGLNSKYSFRFSQCGQFTSLAVMGKDYRRISTLN